MRCDSGESLLMNVSGSCWSSSSPHVAKKPSAVTVMYKPAGCFYFFPRRTSRPSARYARVSVRYAAPDLAW